MRQMANIVYLSDSPEFTQALIEERLDDIERIMGIFHDVYPRSIEQWLAVFQGAENPHREINRWQNIAELYDMCTIGMSYVTCNEVFKRLFLISADLSFIPPQF